MTDAASGSAIPTRIITSLAAVGHAQVQPVSVTSTVVVTGTVSMGTVTTGTTVQMSGRQQAMLAKVQSQMKLLASSASRTPEQDRLLHLLMMAQQQLHAQGCTHTHTALTASCTAVASSTNALTVATAG